MSVQGLGTCSLDCCCSLLPGCSRRGRRALRPKQGRLLRGGQRGRQRLVPRRARRGPAGRPRQPAGCGLLRCCHGAGGSRLAGGSFLEGQRGCGGWGAGPGDPDAVVRVADVVRIGVVHLGIECRQRAMFHGTYCGVVAPPPLAARPLGRPPTTGAPPMPGRSPGLVGPHSSRLPSRPLHFCCDPESGGEERARRRWSGRMPWRRVARSSVTAPGAIARQLRASAHPGWLACEGPATGRRPH